MDFTKFCHFICCNVIKFYLYTTSKTENGDNYPMAIYDGFQFDSQQKERLLNQFPTIKTIECIRDGENSRFVINGIEFEYDSFCDKKTRRLYDYLVSSAQTFYV